MRPWLSVSVVLAALAGCSLGRGDPAPSADAADGDPAALSAGSEPAAPAGPIAAIDDEGRLAVISGRTVTPVLGKHRARPSLDGTAAVMTLPDDAVRSWGSTLVNWVSLPAGDVRGELQLPARYELTATSLDGDLVGLTTLAEPAPDGAIADARERSSVMVASRTAGVLFETELDGNFAPEAFSRETTEGGVPAQVFLLEYIPAEAPRFYRVRVLSTETGEVSLPVNLRDKAQSVDERMAGFSRSQVVAHEHGLLFTLYRGTIDGTPDGEPDAFVHTLDFGGGVWCLDVDPRLELERLPGSLAVGGDRLYVASANGNVGSFRIPSITDPDLSPEMDWVIDVHRTVDEAPTALADRDGVYLAFDDG